MAYLAVMAYIGRGELSEGNYLYYFGIISITATCIVCLRLHLLRRERQRGNTESKGKR